jgi:hypothetical protein
MVRMAKARIRGLGSSTSFVFIRIRPSEIDEAYFDKHGYSHDSHVGFCSCVIDDVKIDHLFNFEHRHLHDVENVWKKWRHVVAHGHVGYNLLHHCLFTLMLLVSLFRGQLGSKFLYFACVWRGWSSVLYIYSIFRCFYLFESIWRQTYYYCYWKRVKKK